MVGGLAGLVAILLEVDWERLATEVRVTEGALHRDDVDGASRVALALNHL